MTKFRALIVTTVLATTLFGGALTVDGAAEAEGPVKGQRGGSQWCC